MANCEVRWAEAGRDTAEEAGVTRHANLRNFSQHFKCNEFLILAHVFGDMKKKVKFMYQLLLCVLQLQKRTVIFFTFRPCN